MPWGSVPPPAPLDPTEWDTGHSRHLLNCRCDRSRVLLEYISHGLILIKTHLSYRHSSQFCLGPLLRRGLAFGDEGPGGGRAL